MLLVAATWAATCAAVERVRSTVFFYPFFLVLENVKRKLTAVDLDEIDRLFL